MNETPEMNISVNEQTPVKFDANSTIAESPRKCNLSFSFNFDVDDKAAESEESSDSEAPDLQIDVSEIDEISSPRKRPRIEIDDASGINEMEEEIERQLDAKAAKTNLTATNVKNILKHVITNEHVMAMVHNSLHNTDCGFVFEPKLTRAKAKELSVMLPNMPWPITPVKKMPSSEVRVLIEKELSEDDSDEEYNPEKDLDSLLSGNFDELLQTAEQENIVDFQYDADGIFKIPGLSLTRTEQESIGQRTRSKLSLSETPLEVIEQAFVPPDIPNDMCDWDPNDIDPDWDNFLKDFNQPLGHDATIDDDPEADPEYNILEDKETDFFDKEELRMDKAVKVSRKEVDDLVAEVYEDMFPKPEKPKKRKLPENPPQSMPDNSLNDFTIVSPPSTNSEASNLFTTEQLQLLSIQMRQYVQLTVQHFGMTYLHPQLNNHAKICKENLNSLSELNDSPTSVFNVMNLPDALTLVSEWEKKFQNSRFRAEYTNFVNAEAREDLVSGNGGHKYTPKFHQEFFKVFSECKALMFPQLLPHSTFRTSLNNSTRGSYSKSEDSLIAIGLEIFTPIVKMKPTKFTAKRLQLMDVAELISKHMMPKRTVKAIFRRIEMARASDKPSPIKYYFTNGAAPATIHCITLDCQLTAPKDQPIDALPPIWQNYMARARRSSKNNRRPARSLWEKSPGRPFDLAKRFTDFHIDRSFRDIIVNMLPSTGLKHISPQPVGESNDESMEIGVDSTSDNSRSPQLRKTTPRLAKIRSAQNMKLLTQVSSTKPMASCTTVKTRTKSKGSKNSGEAGGSTKGDNEDEIAELMLASTTIKKDTASRKKAKQARFLENVKRLVDADNEEHKEERAAKFAASFLQKLHSTLEASAPETLKAVLRIKLEYHNKFDTINRKESETPSSSQSSKEIKERGLDEIDILTINFYHELHKHLQDYPELSSELLLFLKPHQAAAINEMAEYTMLQKMNDFIDVVTIYFAKQPSRITRIRDAITHLAADRYVTLKTVLAMMDPILRDHPLVMEKFLQVWPTGKPPESLFDATLFENLTCPVGPYDKHKIYSQDSPEVYENIELPLPISQDDPYGGDNCKCDCHESADGDLKSVAEHCVSCGTRFHKGKIYLQTSEGLRPAKITFPGDEEEKLENIARVSLKTSERFIPPSVGTRRHKSSKNEPIQEETTQKQYATKTSPTKESDDGEKSMTRSSSRRGAKSPPKTSDHRKSLPRATEVSGISGIGTGSGVGEPTSPLKSKRETRAERREAKLELKNTGIIDSGRVNDGTCSGTSETCEDSTSQARILGMESSDSEANATCDKFEALDIEESEMIDDTEETTNFKAWTRQEDMILLQNIKKDYSESTFAYVSAMLGDRTVEQVKERCQTLLSLLQKMV